MLENLKEERAKKLSRYRAHAEAYPARVRRDLTLGEVLARFGTLSRGKRSLHLTGRVVGMRDQGKIMFLDLADESGKLQLIFEEGAERFGFLKETLDIGDFVEARGTFTKTKRGEMSMAVSSLRIVAKSLRPIPAHWYGLENVETRLRKRYLDLLVHPETRDLFRKKETFWRAVRAHLARAGFLEAETPVLEAVPGGADAEPFVTHMNALDTDFYLRISLELPLKRLLVGGFEKVFEIGRIFRNEGIDREHLQDYTQMECYAAYWDYRDMMRFTERLYRDVVRRVCGTLKVKVEGHTIDWGKRWPTVDYYEAFREGAGVDLAQADRDELFRKARAFGLAPEPKAGRGRLIDLIYKKAVRPKLLGPCFLVDPPVDIEPLAKRSEKDPNRVERFQIMAAGTELGKGFSELNDPLDQRKRFEEQERARAAGDREAQRLDEDFLEALEYGMPPAAGFGLSERFFAVIMDRSVRETVIFPLMRRES